MIRGKKYFTAASIVAMSLMFVSLAFGFVEDGYHYYSGSYSYYYGYRIGGYSDWRSYAEYCGEWYWPLVAATVVYITLGIIAVALYKRRLVGINIANLILTVAMYVWATFVGIDALYYGNDAFGAILLSTCVGVAFPLHLAADIVALTTQKDKKMSMQPPYPYQVPMYAAPVYPYQPPVYVAPAAPVTTAPVVPAPAAPVVSPVSNEADETLKQLKALRDAGVLTEEEYNEKRQQYVKEI